MPEFFSWWKATIGAVSRGIFRWTHQVRLEGVPAERRLGHVVDGDDVRLLVVRVGSGLPLQIVDDLQVSLLLGSHEDAQLGGGELVIRAQDATVALNGVETNMAVSVVVCDALGQQ